MKSIEKVIKGLPLGVSALMEKVIKNRHLTLIIIKDDFDESVFSSKSTKLQCKSARIKCKGVISAHMVIKLETNFNTEYYLFHFNYYNSDSLKLAVNLGSQNEMYIILCNRYNEYKVVNLYNNVKEFFKKYLFSCINYGYQWSEKEYNDSIINFVGSFPNLSDLWDEMGNDTTLDTIKNDK